MALTAVIGDSVQIGTGAAFQTTVVVTTAAGKQFSDTFTYDGTAADITAQVKQRIAQKNAQGKIPFVAPGTQLDLTDPAPVQPPAPPAGFDVWQQAQTAYRRFKRLLDDGVLSMTAQRVATAKAAADALYLAAFEDFV